MTNLTIAENAALVSWTGSDRSHWAFMAAVREAIGITERQHQMSEDFRLAAADHALEEVAGMLRRFDTPGDVGRTRALVGDLTQIVERARKAMADR